MKRNTLLFAVLAALLLAGTAGAQEFWEKKPYTEWSKEQCKKLLENAPWAAHQGARDVQNVAFTQSSTGGQDTEKRIDYFAQIRSALPVRQAVIRRAMIEAKYDKMSADQKKQFDESAAGFLARQYPDAVVIAVEYSTNVEVYDRELARHWQTTDPGALMSQIYLTVRNGQRIQPVSYTPDRGAGRAFQLVFKRALDNGEPIIGPGDKIILELPAPTFDPRSINDNPQLNDPAGSNRGQVTGASGGSTARGLKEGRLVFEFRAEKMKHKGELVF
jgi:hypothetical protein